MQKLIRKLLKPSWGLPPDPQTTYCPSPESDESLRKNWWQAIGHRLSAISGSIMDFIIKNSRKSYAMSTELKPIELPQELSNLNNFIEETTKVSLDVLEKLEHAFANEESETLNKSAIEVLWGIISLRKQKIDDYICKRKPIKAYKEAVEIIKELLKIAELHKRLEELTEYESTNEEVCFLTIDVIIAIAKTIDYKHKTNSISQEGISLIEKTVRMLRLDNQKLINETIKNKGFKNIDRYMDALVYVNENLSKSRNIIERREKERNGFGKAIEKSKDFKKINNISQKISELIQYALTVNKSPNEDAIITIPNITWSQYENISETIGETSWCRISYLDEVLELVATGERHEFLNRCIDTLVASCFELQEIAYIPVGSATYRVKKGIKGKEPDTSYKFSEERKYPDFAIEVNLSSGSPKNLKIFKDFKTKEVWMWDNKDNLEFYVFHGSGYKKTHGYAKTHESHFLRGITPETIKKYVKLIESDKLKIIEYKKEFINEISPNIL